MAAPFAELLSRTFCWMSLCSGVFGRREDPWNENHGASQNGNLEGGAGGDRKAKTDTPYAAMLSGMPPSIQEVKNDFYRLSIWARLKRL